MASFRGILTDYAIVGSKKFASSEYAAQMYSSPTEKVFFSVHFLLIFLAMLIIVQCNHTCTLSGSLFNNIHFRLFGRMDLKNSKELGDQCICIQ